MSKQIRIVLVGDKNQGKSSAVDCIANRPFNETIGDIVSEAIISPDDSITGNTLIVSDSSSNEDHNTEMVSLIKQADALGLVVAADDNEAQKRAVDYWIPMLQSIKDTTPIILVVSKYDLISENKERAKEIQAFVLSVLDLFPCVDTCVLCSAKNDDSVYEIYESAERAIIYPASAVYDRHLDAFHEQIRCILRRVFRLFSKTYMKYMTDEELRDFNKVCFDAPLDQSMVNRMKNKLRSLDRLLYIDEDTDTITEDGFLSIMAGTVKDNQQETVYKTIWSMGYNKKYELLDMPTIETITTQTVEFTEDGIEFLERVFRTYDSNSDGMLSDGDVSKVFATVFGSQPLWRKLYLDQNPFMYPGCPENCYTNENNELTLTGWLSEWVLMLRVAPTETIQTIIMIGYDVNDVHDLFRITKDKEVEYQDSEELNRTVVHSFVFGYKAAGKSMFTHRLIDTPFSANHVPTLCPSTVIAPVNMRSKEHKDEWLILTEVPYACMDEMMQYNNLCDMACILYDTMDLDVITHIREIMSKIPKSMKVLLIANKIDLLPISYEKSDICKLVKEYRGLYQMDEELPISCKEKKGRIYKMIHDCAVLKGLQEPVYEKKKSNTWKYLAFLALTGILASGFIYMRNRK